jgi:hypothetical protein
MGRSADADLPSAMAGADVLGQARALMRDALAGKLTEASLPWAPSAEAAGGA